MKKKIIKPKEVFDWHKFVAKYKISEKDQALLSEYIAIKANKYEEMSHDRGRVSMIEDIKTLLRIN